MSLICAPGKGGRSALLLNRSIQFVNIVCLTVSICALLLMLGVVATEVALRTFFDTSTYLSDEYAGYSLVTLGLMSLATCQLNGKFPRVAFIIGSLPDRIARYVEILFDVVAVGLAILLVWKLSEFELAAIRSGFVAPTLSATPLWIPKLALMFGAATYFVAVCQILAVHLIQLGAGRGSAE